MVTARQGRREDAELCKLSEWSCWTKLWTVQFCKYFIIIIKLGQQNILFTNWGVKPDLISTSNSESLLSASQLASRSSLSVDTCCKKSRLFRSTAYSHSMSASGCTVNMGPTVKHHQGHRQFSTNWQLASKARVYIGIISVIAVLAELQSFTNLN